MIENEELYYRMLGKIREEKQIRDEFISRPEFNKELKSYDQVVNEITEKELEEQTKYDIEQGKRKVQYIITFEAMIKPETTNQMFMDIIKKDVVCSGRALKAIVSEVVIDVNN